MSLKQRNRNLFRYLPRKFSFFNQLKTNGAQSAVGVRYANSIFAEEGGSPHNDYPR